MGIPLPAGAEAAPAPPAAPQRRRRLRAWLAALAAALVLLGLLWGALQTPPAREALRERVAVALAERLPGARLTGGARVTGSFRLAFGPVVLPSRTPGAPPLVTVQRALVRPRIAALLRRRLEPAAIRLEGVRVEAGPGGQALRAELEALARRPARAAGPRDASAPPTLSFSDLRLRIPLARGARALVLELGPLSGRASAERDGREVRAELRVALPGGGDGALRGRWDGDEGSLTAHLRRIAPEALPAALRSRLPVRLEGGTFDVSFEAPHLSRGTGGAAAFSVEARGLVLRANRLAQQPVGPVGARLGGTLRWDRDAGELTLEGGRAELGTNGRAVAAVEGALRRRPEASFRVAVRAASVDWEAALSALPEALRPPPTAPRLRGTVAGHLALSGPLRRPSAWRIEAELDTAGLAALPSVRGALVPSQPFTWRAPLPGGGEREVVVGPSNPAFVALSSLPVHVWRAVVLSEDAGFFVHHGFDVREVQDALERSGAHVRLRGASTLTQQLAKNLFLSPERTLARKVREALATIALEASASKRRLLEIYLTIAEWGPGVYGIGEAAHHWFGKDARDLSPKEAAFLATVIPNPIRYELYRRRGGLTERWDERVRDLLLKLRAADALTDEQFFEAWYAPLVFR